MRYIRLDRLIIKDNHAIIIDYKTSKGDNDINQLTNQLKLHPSMDGLNLSTLVSTKNYWKLL